MTIWVRSRLYWPSLWGDCWNLLSRVSLDITFSLIPALCNSSSYSNWHSSPSSCQQSVVPYWCDLAPFSSPSSFNPCACYATLLCEMQLQPERKTIEKFDSIFMYSAWFYFSIQHSKFYHQLLDHRRRNERMLLNSSNFRRPVHQSLG